MSLTLTNRVVVFDYGEVISRGPNSRTRAELIELAGVPEAQFFESYEAHRDDLDRGIISVREYWKLIEADLGTSWSESRIHELWVADFTGWISVEPGTFDVIADLHAGGTRVALLSNAGFDFGSPFRFSPMARFFERMFVSAEMLMLKPEAEIYLEVVAELGITPAQMIFIDNKQMNVDGAAALGIAGHHFVTPEGLRAYLETLQDR